MVVDQQHPRPGHRGQRRVSLQSGPG
jgi:hypothetical protein